MSTKQFEDSKGRTGFLTASSQGGLSVESNDTLSDDLSDGEDAPDREGVLRSLGDDAIRQVA